MALQINLGNTLGDWHKDLENKTADTQQETLDSDGCADTANPVLKTKDAKVIWHDVQASLRQTLGERVHTSWTGQLDLQLQSDTMVALTTQSQFVAGRIDSKYGELVRSLWLKHDNRQIQICAQADVEKTLAANNAAISASAPQSASSGQQANRVNANRVNNGTGVVENKPAQAYLQNMERSVAKPVQARSMQGSADIARERFTFDNFVVGPSNELAYAVARRISSSAECLYNPILLHGPHGLGKTHLLSAIKSEALKANPKRRVRLITAEDFVATFIQSVRAQGRSEIDAFKSSLRDVDLLIIDDAHFIADKPGSQEELLHTLISLVDAGKQILLASDRHPHKIDKASERLKSYLCGGLICDIGPCDYELRIRILDRLIERRRSNGHPRLAMPRNARDHLAARINATPRDLEGAFNQVLARSEFLGTDLTLENVQEALTHSHYMSKARPTVDRIQRATCKEFGIRMEEMLSKRRARAIARPRQVAMYLCKTLTKRSLPDIGRRFGGRDHTTVIHAIKRIEALRKEDAVLNTHLQNLDEELNG